MKYPNIVSQVAKELNLPEDVVDKTYKAFWQFIKESIIELPLKEELTEEEFNKLNTNFNVPSLGKLSCTYDRMLGVKKRFKYIKNIRENK